MQICNEAASFENLEEKFRDKLSIVKACGNLRGGWCVDTIHHLADFKDELVKISKEIEDYKEVLCDARNQIDIIKKLNNKIGFLTEKLIYMKSNLPSHLPCISQNVKNTYQEKDKDYSEDRAHKKQPQNNQDIASNPQKPIPKFNYITLEEFQTVPKYSKGRIQYDQINKAVDKLNNTVELKYNLMRKLRTKLSPIEMSYVQDFKRQINKETKGLYFVVNEDFTRFGTLRMDSTARNILIILRTLKKLKEVRGPGNLLRYCIIDHN